jgi:CRISPR-associated endonuclease/helicase Cas3
MGEKFGLGPACRVAGLYHDLGKYSAEFQRRIRGADVSVDHSTAGAKVVFDRARGIDKVVAEVLAVDVDFPMAFRAEGGLDQIIRGGADQNTNDT